MVLSSFSEATQALRKVVAQVVHSRSVSFPSHYPSLMFSGCSTGSYMPNFFQPVAFFVMSSPRFQLPGILYALWIK